MSWWPGLAFATTLEDVPPDLIESAAHLGRSDEAWRHLVELERLADTTSGPILRAMLAYCRPLLATDHDGRPVEP